MNSVLLTENISRLWASLLAGEFQKLGSKDVFIAPGMRNAPLIAGFKAQPNLNLHVGMDERGLSYQALGYAKASGKPAILICTSGTAAANFFPAVIEAKKSQVPLIVISADRPLELSQTDANQTINQKNLYSAHAKHFLDLGAPDEKMNLRALIRLSAHAYESALSAPMGPVHINIAFREPLDGKVQNINSDVLKQANKLASSQAPSRQKIPQSGVDVSGISELLKKAANPLIIVGDQLLSEIKQKREHLITALSACPYLLNVDVTSGLKFDFSLSDGLVPTFDHPEVFEYFHNTPPDLVVHFGGRLTSKHYYRFLNEHADSISVVHVTSDTALSDSGHAVTHVLQANPLDAIISLSKSWKNEHTRAAPFTEFIQKKIDVIEKSDKLAFPYISKRIMEMLPKQHALAIGNSTLIRSFDSYASISQAKSLDVLTHRGVSGIEGFFASASGYALATKTPITLMLGDVSALHDLNSLELVARSQTPIICVVVNNYGGGIFTLLNLEKGEDLYPVITSPHERKLAPIARAFDLKTYEVSKREEFESAYQEALASNKSAFIEVLVDTNANNSIYQQLKTIKLS